MSNAKKRKAIRQIRKLLKPLDRTEQITLLREVAHKIEIDAIGEQLVALLAQPEQTRKKK